MSSTGPRSQLNAAFAPIVEAGYPVVTTDLATAELVKVAANSFLATKISYINAMAEVCEATGADVQDLAKSLAYDSRIGGRFLQPGLGFGGGCLPKDIRAFVHRAEELGVGKSVAFLRQVDAINNRRRARTVDLVREQAGGVAGRGRACAASELRSSPTPTTSATPRPSTSRGCSRRRARIVTVYDPEAMDNARRAYPDLRYADGRHARRRTGAEVVVLLTEWDQFRSIDPERLAEVVHRRSVVDGRHALDPRRGARPAGSTALSAGPPDALPGRPDASPPPPSRAARSPSDVPPFHGGQVKIPVWLVLAVRPGDSGLRDRAADLRDPHCRADQALTPSPPASTRPRAAPDRDAASPQRIAVRPVHDRRDHQVARPRGRTGGRARGLPVCTWRALDAPRFPHGARVTRSWPPTTASSPSPGPARRYADLEQAVAAIALAKAQTVVRSSPRWLDRSRSPSAPRSVVPPSNAIALDGDAVIIVEVSGADGVSCLATVSDLLDVTLGACRGPI